MRLGYQLPIQSQSTVFVEPWEAAAGPGELVASAQACEAAGFDYVAVCDHVAIPADKAEAMSTVWYDTIATLGYLAAATSTVRLLTHVYVPVYRHPLQVASAFATLDRLSGGRVVLGVGAGHVEGEFAALGVDFAGRGALLDESIDALRACFDTEFPSHDGPEWSFTGLGVAPRPVQARIPIWVGGSSKAAMRRAAERGDGWLPQGPPAMGMAEGIAYIRSIRGDAPIDLGYLSGPTYVGEPSWDVGRCLSGPPEKIASKLRPLRDLGITHLQIRSRSRDAAELCDQITAFGTEVGPLLLEA